MIFSALIILIYEDFEFRNFYSSILDKEMNSRKRNKLKLSFRRQSTPSFGPCKKVNINAEESVLVN